MVKPNFTIGTVFEDGGLYYEVQAVLPSGDYISKRVDKVPEPEQEIPIPIPEKTEDKPVKKTEDNPVKRTRTTTRTKNTGGRKKQ